MSITIQLQAAQLTASGQDLAVDLTAKYISPAKVVVGQRWNAGDFNQMGANFEANVPAMFTTKGDLAVANGSKSLERLGVGSDGEVLIADSGETGGLKWAGGAMPVGMIILWSGAVGSIPSGWQLCDGSNGTRDLRDRFVVGAGSTYVVGATGGAATMDLSHTHTPNSDQTGFGGSSHTHSQGATGSKTHTHTDSDTTGTGDSTSVDTGSGNWMASSSHTHDWDTMANDGGHTHTNPDTGSGGASHNDHSIGNLDSDLSASQSKLPSYYALAFIQRVS